VSDALAMISHLAQRWLRRPAEQSRTAKGRQRQLPVGAPRERNQGPGGLHQQGFDNLFLRLYFGQLSRASQPGDDRRLCIQDPRGGSAAESVGRLFIAMARLRRLYQLPFAALLLGAIMAWTLSALDKSIGARCLPRAASSLASDSHSAAVCSLNLRSKKRSTIAS
jgi:hypothetical protein